MTNDIYGSDTHDQDAAHDENLHAEHDVHEEPSDFEFTDPEHTITEAEGDEHAALSSENTVKGRSPLLPILAAVGGIAVLGVIAWSQFGGSSNAPPMAMQQPVSSMPSLAIAAQPPAPAAVAPKTDVNLAPASTISATADIAPPAPVTETVAVPAPVVSAAPVLTPAVTPSAPVAMPAPLPSAALQQAAPASEVETLNTRIDALQKALDQANQQLGQMTNSMTAAAPSDASLKEMQDRLERLEQQAAKKHTRHDSVSHSDSLDNMPVATHEVHHATHKAVAHASRSVKKQQAEAIEQSKWVLRAAAPGQAWVASSPTSRDLRQLQVGDTLAGVGRVTAIEQKGGAWIVQGTHGIIQ